VEFLGSVVNISLDGGATGDLVATLPDSRFFEQPVEIGESVFLSWNAEDAHPLAA
jgi:putative spermidine/putrescine transport system ATP-binding protein